jgi:CRP/FNR family transcriptional regulator
MTNLALMLDKAPVFRCFTAQERLALMKLVVNKDYQRGEFIAHYGEIWPQVFIVARGEIHVQKFSPDGRALGTIWLGTGDVFWSPSVFDRSPMPAALEVKAACKIYLWHGEEVISYARTNPDALWEMCLLLVQRIRQASDYVEELAFKPVVTRVARILLDQFEDQPDGKIQREFSLEEMSTMVGTTPVMVSKVLSRLDAQGIIKTSRRNLALLNRKALEEILNV